MDFNTAVERISFALAVLLFEDELPENVWQVATVDQCLSVRYVFSKRIAEDVGGKPILQSVLSEANRRLEKIVAEADFKTSRALCDKYSDFLKKLAYERLFSLASTFDEACQIGEVIDLWRCSSDRDLRDPERARVTQLCFSMATLREHFFKLFNHVNYTVPMLVGRLPEEDELKAAEKLLEDNPSDKEILLGYRFPPTHPYYARAVEKEIERIFYLWDFAGLYEKVVDLPEHRIKVATAFRKQLESAKVPPGSNIDPYPYCRTYELAIEYGDEETAQACYNFVIVNVENCEQERFRQQGYRWIVQHANPESEEYKKFKSLIPTRPRKKKVVEV